MKMNTFAIQHHMQIYAIRRISTEIWNRKLNFDLRKEIEKYWSEKFQYENLYDKNCANNKMYVLSMFPYPSGKLHMGHIRVYTISDTMARFYRLNGKNVFHPIGWDAFGLPAENAAIERNIPPDEWTRDNISQMKAQLLKFSFTFDWSNEINTSSPEYYRWTQYIFLKLYEAGLVYRKEAVVKWDPVDKTVLANEQVDENGCSWRSGAVAENKLLKQWFIKTSKFAEDLYEGLSERSLVNWRDIIDIQRHWIGACDGYSFDVELCTNGERNTMNVWVKNARSLARAEFIAIAPGSLLEIALNERLEVKNPFDGRILPVYITEDVEYPQERDTYVGVPSENDADLAFAFRVGCKTRLEYECDGVPEETLLELAKERGFGGYKTSSKLRDWLISRQRYWGTPIPVVHCPKCGPQPVSFDQLPVILPPLEANLLREKGLNSFLKESDWINTTCPKCGNEDAKKETDTMDTFVDSSWYYLRYCDPCNNVVPFSKEAMDLMPVDVYIGGKEHAVLHLYYARFMCHFLHSIGLIPQKEPFTRLLTQGMVLGKTFIGNKGQYFKPEEIELNGDSATVKGTGEKLKVKWEKMSKSRYNGVEPNKVLEQYGIDTTRLFLLFSVAPFSNRQWNSDLFPDVLKWQNRMWMTIQEFLKARTEPLECLQPWLDQEKVEEKIRDKLNFYIRGATHQYKLTQQLASAFTHCQALTTVLRNHPREVRKFSKIYEKALAIQIIMIAPMAPHFAATLWEGFISAPGRLNDSQVVNWDENVLGQRWPVTDPDYKFPLEIMLNKARLKTYMLKPELNVLTSEKAHDKAFGIPKVRNFADKWDLKEGKFKLWPDYGAVLEFYSPKMEIEDESENREEERRVSDSI